ncbi:MAG: hypothetical protein RBT78_01300 [Kiritimatiellia bacterium]|jgi:dissimilatory sulfite reductase (desulfoviridin) alpha/beta subunit|nr:hypothetical protein [Kiritimatiellia bacterium]
MHSSSRSENPSASAWQITVCRGAESCTAGLVRLSVLAIELEQAVRYAGWADHLRRAYPDGFRPHHRLRIAVAACPNGCSQPQICDLGLIAWSAPLVDAQACTGCGTCLPACRESALALTQQRITFAPPRCVGCAACSRVCGAGALRKGPLSFRLLLGGHLGRHPAWAEELPPRLLPHQIGPAVERVIRLLILQIRPNERVGQTVRRLGLAAFAEAHASET